MLRWRNRWVAWSAFGLAVTALVAATLPRMLHSSRAAATPAPLIVASSRPDPHSCKASPPVVVTLGAGAAAGDWHVRVDALDPTADVVVAIGSGTAGAETTRQIVWRGALARGEGRDFDLHFDAPAGAGEVWAAADVQDQRGAVQRGRAALALEDGKAVSPLAAAALGGRLVTDTDTGRRVVEFDGAVGGGR